MSVRKVDRELNKLLEIPAGCTVVLVVGAALLVHFVACEWRFPDTAAGDVEKKSDEKQTVRPSGSSKIFGPIHARDTITRRRDDGKHEYDRVWAGIIGLGIPALMICFLIAIWVYSYAEYVNRPPRPRIPWK